MTRLRWLRRPAVHGNPKARQDWAVDQVKKALTASRNLGLSAHATFSGALAWPYVYPWPQRPAGLIEEAFDELARRWLPILDHAEEMGVDVCYEIHPGEDLHDGVSYEMFLDRVGGHARACMLYDPSHYVLQHLDYLEHIDIYHDRIRMFHVKDAELNPTGRQGVYGGYQSWVNRAGRFRSPGDGQADFVGIFSKLTQYGFDGWAVVEWECCLKHPEDGAREGGGIRAQPHHPRHRKGLRRFRGCGARIGPRTGGCWVWIEPAGRGVSRPRTPRGYLGTDEIRRAVNGDHRGACGAGAAYPAGHGGGRARCLHRRGPPHRGAD
jgi:sugar phosphate isomerase/epimerase